MLQHHDAAMCPDTQGSMYLHEEAVTPIQCTESVGIGTKGLPVQS